MNFTTKRKREDIEPDSKKTKNYINDEQKELYTTSNEWPVYQHPDGGIIKITPWGILRQVKDEKTGEYKTNFEDQSFGDVIFQLENSNEIYHNNIPTTPQSLYQDKSPSDGIKLSPSDEAELYVMDGYQQQQYQTEQEHYLGMEDEEMN
ncbi:hypothetical protein HYPBUDRAFT_159590 [Hyphopichia burtonii NRRL Y-1933]|uniref:Uncharacterized protein n=1 Tax=Hyphopichia burtonii NRRL Y-1933 TaxID=984485 RepID=A0A1E4RRA5_9ASCO|nr:hypothetical protein HYPBUDRAFT_159590 [Hyphopichia burtonii NRRL Y-1933]ODV69741.1 hypothetical protein HYPBUDRAFT_159590 [Hyphopichia burtonii NRRL Y-1933]